MLPSSGRGFRSMARMSKRQSLLRTCLDVLRSVKSLSPIFLRIMTGSAVHDICALYGVAPSTCYKWFNDVLGVVYKRMPLGGIPSKENALRRMAVKFAEYRPHSNPLTGCVGQRI